MPTPLHRNSQLHAQPRKQLPAVWLRPLRGTKAAIKMTSLPTPRDTFKSFALSDFFLAFQFTNTDRVPTVCQAPFQVQEIQKWTNSWDPLLETGISSLKQPLSLWYLGFQMLHFFHVRLMTHFESLDKFRRLYRSFKWRYSLCLAPNPPLSRILRVLPYLYQSRSIEDEVDGLKNRTPQ